MRSKDAGLGLLAIAALAAVLLTAVAAGPALAAKGGNGHGHGGTVTPATATLTVSPNPVPAWGYVYTVTGTGFTPGNAVNFVLGSTAIYDLADENGVATSTWGSWTPGTYTISAKEFINGSWVNVGSVTFDVVER